jgi:hypothetical protein
MKKHITLLVLLTAFALGACKKEKEEDVAPTPPDSITGTLTKQREVYIIDSVKTYDLVFAEFKNGNSPIQVKSVIFNDSVMPYSMDYWLRLPVTTNCNWKIVGDNGVPDFTFSNPNPIPSTSNYNMMPDSINASKPFTFSVSGVANADFGGINIGDGSGHSILKDFKIVSSSGTVTVSVPELNQLNKNATQYFFYFWASNIRQEVFDGKTFTFENQLSVSKVKFRIY